MSHAGTSYHHISTLGVDHILRTARSQNPGRGQQSDLPIFNGDVVVCRVGCGHDEPVDDEEIKVVHIAPGVSRQRGRWD